MTIDVRTQLGVISGQRQAVIAEGPDALKFLQGQLSQDLDSLAPGEASWSLLLHPQGKISAWFRITRATNDRFVMDLDAGWADEVLTRLNRFKLRTDIYITLAPWTSLTIVGPGADDLAVAGVEHDMVTSWAGVQVRDVFGPDLNEQSVDVLPMSATELDAVRIEAGVPKMGVELDESTIPAAAGIVEQSVSFTKGCYTGQELVARIDSRGNNVPKRLLSVVLSGDIVPGSQAVITADDASIGMITSASYSAHLDAVVGLAYISRAGAAGQTVTVDIDGTAVTAELRELPLVRG
jgi:folate-binding protein YgfZ